METNDKKDRRDDIFSRNVRAGKRTYFFDVKATRADDYYLTITESTKRFDDDGSFHYEKHRLFLYKEDFEKFSNCLAEVTEYIITEKGTAPIRGESHNHHSNGSAQAADANTAPTSSAETVAADELSETKSEEEVDLVEDAHEKAMAGDTAAEPEVDGNVDDATNGQSEAAPENIDPINIGSETETKTE